LREGWINDLHKLLLDYATTGDDGEVAAYLVPRSGLPGPRGNIELAQAFADAAGDVSTIEPEKILSLIRRLVNISPEEAPVNDPREFLPFCGAVALRAVGAKCARFLEEALGRLQGLAEDPRWRMREGVAMGLQALLASAAGEEAFEELERWIADDQWLDMRAVAAGVAEPSLLRSEVSAKHALALHRKIFERVLASHNRASPGFRVLRQGLGYSLSVVVSAIPEEGFNYIRELVDTGDKDLLWVVKENLKKARLVKHYPDQVLSIRRYLRA
jgi:hypothetical protein